MRALHVQSRYSLSKKAAAKGVKLVYLNTGKLDDPVAHMMELPGGKGYNDVFVYAPVKPVVEMGDKLLARDGCLNFFAGPTNPAFSAEFNFYNVHYGSTHIVGTSGGNTDDMREALRMMESGDINPAAMITHIGGMNTVVDTVLRLPEIKGAERSSSTPIRICRSLQSPTLPSSERNDPFYADLAEICSRHNELWCFEAEQYVLRNAKDI